MAKYEITGFDRSLKITLFYTMMGCVNRQHTHIYSRKFPSISGFPLSHASAIHVHTYNPRKIISKA